MRFSRKKLDFIRFEHKFNLKINTLIFYPFAIAKLEKNYKLAIINFKQS